MSAIAGVIQLDGAPVDRATLQRMLAQLTPYGSDAQNLRREEQAGFVHTLLRSTPEESFDRQPLWHEASQTLLVFDGRVDNREELAQALGLTPADCVQLADSALVLQAWLRWDSQCLSRLLGDFALACWQPRLRRLWLARDPLGLRPLFWYRNQSLFAFASLPKALFAVPGVPRQLSETHVHDLLCLLPTDGAHTLYQDVWRVEPGQRLLLDGDQLHVEYYHRFDPQREIRLANDDEYVEGFLEQFQRAVACRLRSTGPVASHLSGGFDSGVVTALAARALADRNERLHAFTAVPRAGYAEAVPRGRVADEGPAAQALAACFPSIDHHLITTTGISPLRDLMQDTARYDRAPLNPCNQVWINAIEGAARQRGARVLLTGLLGNVCFSYTGDEYLPWLVSRGRLVRWWREMTRLKAVERDRTWLGLLALSFGSYVPGPLWQLLKGKNRTGSLRDYTAVHPDLQRRVQSEQRARQLGWDTDYRPWRDGRYMRATVLHRVDLGDVMIGSNAAGLDMRDPTADVRLFEYCLALPRDQYLRNGQRRYLLTRALPHIAPAAIWQTRIRGLQAADWHENIDPHSIRAEIEQLRAHGGVGHYVDLQAMTDLLDNWPSHGWHSQAAQSRLRLKLLRGLAVGTFVRYVDERNR